MSPLGLSWTPRQMTLKACGLSNGIIHKLKKQYLLLPIPLSVYMEIVRLLPGIRLCTPCLTTSPPTSLNCKQ